MKHEKSPAQHRASASLAAPNRLKGALSKSFLALSVGLLSCASAYAETKCEDVRTSVANSVETAVAEIEKEFEQMEKARDALRDCEIHLNSKLSSYVGEGYLGSILKAAKDMKLDKAACAQLKKQVEQQISKVDGVIDDKLGDIKDKVEPVLDPLKQVYDAFQGDVGQIDQVSSPDEMDAVRGSVGTPARSAATPSYQTPSSGKTTWDSLGKLLGGN